MTPDDYVDSILRLQTRMEMFAKSIGLDLERVLNARFKKLASEVATGAMGTLKGVADVEREFREIIQNADVDQTLIITKGIETATLAGYGAESKATLETVKPYDKRRMTNKAWAHVVEEQNMSVNDIWDKYTGTSSQRLKSIPRLAYQNGWGMTRTVNQLREATQLDKRSAQAVSRTSIMSASNVARGDVISQTDVEQEIFLATLDSRTTEICRRNDSKVFSVGKGSHPPLHISCRSTRVAVPSDMTPTEFKKGLERSSRGVDGKTKIIDFTNYGAWLKTQPKAFQEEVLGKKRAGLLRSGKITYSKMWVGNRYLSVKELEKKYKQGK